MQNVPYEEMGIMQYRMMHILEKRRSYREKLEKIQGLIETPIPDSNVSEEHIPKEKKNKSNSRKQKDLIAFFPPKIQ